MLFSEMVSLWKIPPNPFTSQEGNSSHTRWKSTVPTPLGFYHSSQTPSFLKTRGSALRQEAQSIPVKVMITEGHRDCCGDIGEG